MKILHIANFGYNKQGAHYYCTDRKISAGLIENGHFVYDFSFRDMSRMGTIFKTKKLGAGWANQQVLKIIENLQPELILIGHSDLMGYKALQSIREKFPSIKIAFWYVDPIYIEHKLDFIKEYSPYLDAIFCTTGGEYLKKLKCENLTVAFMPNIGHCNVEVLKQFENKKQLAYDFIFCGAVYKEPLREKFLNDLGEALDDASIKYNYFGCFGQQSVFGHNYYKVLSNSAMGLNYSRRNDITLYSSDRIVQLTGNGLLTFSPKIPEFELLYTQQEIIYFENQPDLAEKIKFYKAHPDAAAKIAEAGWLKTCISFNAQRITAYMLEVVFKQKFTQIYEWQKEVYR